MRTKDGGSMDMTRVWLAGAVGVVALSIVAHVVLHAQSPLGWVADAVMLASVALVMHAWRARAKAASGRMVRELQAAKESAEASLREVTALRTALDQHSIYSVADRRGRIVDVNAGFCAISGYTREELIGQDHRLLNSGTHPKPFWVEMWRTIASGRPWHGEVCNRRKDGSLYWVDSTIVPVLGADGAVERYISNRFDITEQKAAAARIERSHVFMRHTIDALDAHLAIVDSAGRIVVVNEAWARFAAANGGDPRAVGVGADYLAISAKAAQAAGGIEGAREAHEAILAALRGDQSTHTIEYPCHSPSEQRWFQVVVQRVMVGGEPHVLIIHQNVTRLRKLRETVKEERHRLSLALEAGALGVWEWTVPDDRAFVDEVWLRQLGLNADEAPRTGAEAFALVHPDDIERVREAVWAYIEGRSDRYEMVFRMRHADGSWRWIQDRARAVERDVRGRARRVVGLHADITAQREAERRLVEQGERLELALMGGELGLWDWNPQTGRVVFDEQWAAMIGLRVADLREHVEEWSSRVHLDDLPAAIAAVEMHFSGVSAMYEAEFRMRHADGAWRWVLARGKVVERDAQGRPVRMVGTHLDVTDRRLAEERLAESERRARAILEGTDVIAWEFDLEANRFTYVSPQAAKLGYSLDEWRTPGFWQAHIVDEDRDAAVSYCIEEVRAGRNHRMTYRMRKADGGEVWMDDSVSVERGPGGRTTLRGVLIDVTEQRRLRQAAEAASRAKSEFLANMSHEIRTPLTAILGYADLLREDGDLGKAPASRLQTIDTIRLAGQHLLTIINDVLDLSKIEAGRMTVESIETDLHALLHEIESLIRARAAGKGVGLEVRFVSPVPSRVRTDPTRLRQILLNLLGNAVKFTHEGRVELRVAAVDAAGGRVLRFEVEDTGPGMGEEEAARLFQVFSQADASTTRRFGGTGLGLTISRRLASMLGGRVQLQWTRPGAGSCFCAEVALDEVPGCEPLESLESVRVPAPALAPPAETRLAGRILVAEDGPDNQRLIAHHLRKAGATVEVADNGRIALELIDAAAARGEAFDLLVSDMQMPEMDGYTLARTLRARGSAMPIVALTAHAMTEDRQRCLDAGCDDYASKPIDKAHLLRTCAAWLGRRSGRGEPRAAA